MNEVLTFDRLPVAVSQMIDKLNRIEMILVKPVEPSKPQRFDFNGAFDYLNNKLGVTFSKSKLQKSSALGTIPCRKFNNRLVFEKDELDAWVQSQTVTVSDNSAVLTLAASANRKLKK